MYLFLRERNIEFFMCFITNIWIITNILKECGGREPHSAGNLIESYICIDSVSALREKYNDVLGLSENFNWLRKVVLTHIKKFKVGYLKNN